MSKHSPLPWRFITRGSTYIHDKPHFYTEIVNDVPVAQYKGTGIAILICPEEEKKEGLPLKLNNARLIVKAVNSHDRLVGALSKARSLLIEPNVGWACDVID